MKVIAIDFDGTIFHKDIFPDPEVYASIQNKVSKLMDNPENFIVIYTARRKDQRQIVEGQLEGFGIPYHALVMEKMRADVYIDDKNVGGLKWPRT